jgi:hypothetical protein
VPSRPPAQRFERPAEDAGSFRVPVHRHEDLRASGHGRRDRRREPASPGHRLEARRPAQQVFARCPVRPAELLEQPRELPVDDQELTSRKGRAKPGH